MNSHILFAAILYILVCIYATLLNIESEINWCRTIHDVRTSLLTFTLASDDALSGGNNMEKLDSLIKFFSDDFTTWNSVHARYVAPKRRLYDTILGDQTSKSHVLEIYANMSTTFYAGFVHTSLMEQSVMHFKDTDGGSIYNTQGNFIRLAMVRPNSGKTTGATIYGCLEIDWIVDSTHNPKILRFFETVMKVVPTKFQ